MQNSKVELYSTSPQFVLGFHGCDKTVADNVIKYGEMLKSSTNDYDWLGSGIYFWEQNYQRAWDWALECQKRKCDAFEPAVIGAVIDLGLCLDLLNSSSIHELKAHFETFSMNIEIANGVFPKNVAGPDKLLRRLDCAVIESLHAERSDEGLPPYDSVRAVFTEANPIYPEAGFKEKSHIQLCIRNPNCIKGFFEPRDVDPNWSVPH